MFAAAPGEMDVLSEATGLRSGGLYHYIGSSAAVPDLRSLMHPLIYAGEITQ